MHIKSKATTKLLLIILAVIFIITALFVLWWYGKFIPGWVEWKEYQGVFGESGIILADKKVSVAIDNNEVWNTPNDWFVQDMIITDIDRDGAEEMVLLVWKHGSFGKHRPQWVRRNDISLKQHIFIYRYDDRREEYIVAEWMSSVMNYPVKSFASYGKDKIVINDINGGHKVWYWLDFGLKLAGEAKDNSVSFAAAGDNLIHEWLYRNIDDIFAEEAFDLFYENIAEDIKQYDIASVNQETPLVTNRSMIGDYPSFGSSYRVADGLSHAGFDIVSCANNHILDRGQEGLETTYNALKDREMEAVGINVSEGDIYDSIKFADCNHINIAFLSYTYGTNGNKMPPGNSNAVENLMNKDRLVKQLRYARLRADAVIVFVHWGTEYSAEIDEQQQIFTDIFLNEGVDVVIGTHPHVLQEYKTISKNDHQMTVFYSLGNFVSGQNEPERLIGGIGEFVINKDVSGKININGVNMRKTVMHQDKEECGIYWLEDYTVDKAQKHIVKGMEEYIKELK